MHKKKEPFKGLFFFVSAKTTLSSCAL